MHNDIQLVAWNKREKKDSIIGVPTRPQTQCFKLISTNHNFKIFKEVGGLQGT